MGPIGLEPMTLCL